MVAVRFGPERLGDRECRAQTGIRRVTLRTRANKALLAFLDK
ncbi:hypothetical protein QTQ03_11800 [Micromonospora sp. WMMA1363]|nr:hypothetical protein [Micromonospora sp. WMMA1363]MDM4720225.1 hypothetical protein [Micromonospora sp. WMMA1363]